MIRRRYEADSNHKCTGSDRSLFTGDAGRHDVVHLRANPLRADGSLVEGDIEVQTQQVFDNLRAVIEAAGGTLSQVVKTTVFLKDLQDFVAMNGVYEAAFGDHRPARSAVQVARLPRDVLVEIEAIVSLA